MDTDSTIQTIQSDKTIDEIFYETKPNINKKNKSFRKKVKKLTLVEEYDSDGRITKVYYVNDNLELDGAHMQRLYDGKKIYATVTATYKEGILNGNYEIKKYKDDVLVYNERSYYSNGRLEGSREITQIVNSKNYYKIYFYSNGLKNGLFREVNDGVVIEGNYVNGEAE